MAKSKRSRRLRTGILAGLVLTAGVVELAPVSVFGAESEVLPVQVLDETWLDAPAAFGDPFYLDAPRVTAPSVAPLDEFLDPAAADLEVCDQQAQPETVCASADAVADPVDEVLEQLLAP